jgi:hypothetical protein
MIGLATLVTSSIVTLSDVKKSFSSVTKASGTPTFCDHLYYHFVCSKKGLRESNR